jgi:DNA-binding NtrC family response regulator
MEGHPRNPHILVIDDEDLICWSLGEGLREAGYSVSTSGSGRDAMRRAESADLVLVDWQLPGADGLQVASALRVAQPSRPVILMTAYGSPELVARATAIGVWHVLLKPFDLEAVVPLVRAALQSASRIGGGRLG